MTDRSTLALALVAVLAMGTLAPAASAAAAGSMSEAPDGTTFVHEGDTVTVAAGKDQAIVGQSDLPAGTHVSVRIQSTDSSQPFLKTTEVVVTEQGRFVATFDFSDVEPGVTFEVSAVSDGESLATENGTVVECSGDCSDDLTATMPVEDRNLDPTDPDEFGSEDLAVPDPVVGAQGEEIPIPVALGDADEATLAIGSEEVNYRINATVSDGTGDGRVVVLFDTVNAGHPAETLSVADEGDSLRVHSGSETQWKPSLGIMDAGSYQFSLHRGQSTTDESAVQVSSMVVQANESAEETEYSYEAWPDGAGEFGLQEDIVTTEQGDVSSFWLSMGTSEQATITVGSDGAGYALTATVSDGNDDGVVQLRFDTAAAGDPDEATLTAADGPDSVTVKSETTLDTGLPAAMFDISLYRGTNTDGADDVGTLAVRDGFYLDTAQGTTSSSAGTNQTAGENAGPDSSSPGDDDFDFVGAGALVGGGVFAIAGVLYLLKVAN
ncbi:DUF7827 domain-containing protein [Haloarchaeobius amylolyticus]|uniref:DUF7827 domain-containing protein n=1 Tax=Haloarchaeobius amylolyticus TaxID=1198296 RepID=UPI00226F94A4|nr:BGTF surface domain-containing protein [Haloarchaeobius amylolyticus]